jgi:hypothetical protein
MTLTIDELAILDMCLMKEIGKNRMELLSDSYLMVDDEMYDRKEKFTSRLEQLSEKIISMKQELENEDLK